MMASDLNLLQGPSAGFPQPVQCPGAVRAGNAERLPDAAPEWPDEPETPEGTNGFGVVFAAALQQNASPLLVATADVETALGMVPGGSEGALMTPARDAQLRIPSETFPHANHASWQGEPINADTFVEPETAVWTPVFSLPSKVLPGIDGLTIDVPKGEPALVSDFRHTGQEPIGSQFQQDGDIVAALLSLNLVVPALADETEGLSRYVGSSAEGPSNPSAVVESPRGDARFRVEGQNLSEVEVRISRSAEVASSGDGPDRKGPGTNSQQRLSVAETYGTADAPAVDHYTQSPSLGSAEVSAFSAGKAAVQKISAAVEAAAQTGRTTLEVKLDPPGLGTVIVRFSGSTHAAAEAGGMQVEIRALHGEARELLQLHANDLKEALGGWEVRIAHVETAAASAKPSERQLTWNSNGGHPRREGSESRQHRNHEDRDAFAGLMNEEGGSVA